MARLHGLWSRSDSESETVLDGETSPKPEQPPDGMGTSAKHRDMHQLFSVGPAGLPFEEERADPRAGQL